MIVVLDMLKVGLTGATIDHFAARLANFPFVFGLTLLSVLNAPGPGGGQPIKRFPPHQFSFVFS